MSARPRLFVTLEGYAVEGGFDQAGGPMTCYAPVIALGRQAGPGSADDLWRRYEQVLDFVPGLGFDGVRVNVEWARVEPRQGLVDESALERYGEVLAHARQLGLGVTIALVDAAWPSWLGQEAWLLPWVVPHVVAHARRVVTILGALADGVVAFTQADRLVARGYLEASMPPWRRGARLDAAFARAQLVHLNALLRADEVVGPRLVRSSAVVSLEAGVKEVAAARNDASVHELYVRSLLGGSGPSRLGAGLLVNDAGEWRVGASPALLSALR